MKRRSFLKKGLAGGLSSVVATNHLLANNPDNPWPNYKYQQPQSLEEALSDEGFLVIRIALTCPKDKIFSKISGAIKTRKMKVIRTKAYFHTPSKETFDPKKLDFSFTIPSKESRVVVLWLDKASEESIISISTSGGNMEYSLGDLIKTNDIRRETPEGLIKSNLLLYNEIGELSLAEIGAPAESNQFRFFMMADPQGGDTDNDYEKANIEHERRKLRTRMKIHNAFIEESIELANKIDQNPAFTMVIGDIVDAWGYKRDFSQMDTFLKRLKSPVLFEVGNHETELDISFEPGYNMSGFNNYMSAQKTINGTDKLLYSYNYGKWHFICWPDPLRSNFWETHPHYFDWLERDLEKHKHMPTIVFQHVPIQPIGISPFNGYYLENTYIKKTMADLFGTHGNVKYVFSGHVHIPMKSAFKTAISYKGVKYINLPATGYRPRAFGEEDYFGGPSQGITMVDIDDTNAEVSYVALTEEKFTFPDQIAEFDTKTYAAWFNPKHELKASSDFENGSFERGLKGWTRNYVYTEDEAPTNTIEVKEHPWEDTPRALYLYSRGRDYRTPGQDRLPQDINQIFQALSTKPGRSPSIKFSYRVDKETSDLEGRNGAFVWIEGYNGVAKTMEMFYSINYVWASMNGKSDFMDIQVELPQETDQWAEAELNIAKDLDRFAGAGTFQKAKVDKIVINIGTWNINDGNPQPFAVYFKDFRAMQSTKDVTSNVNGHSLREKPEKKRWWRGKEVPFLHVAGEHRYTLEDTYHQDHVNKPEIDSI